MQLCRTTIPGITTKENQSEAVLRALALEEMDKHYPAATWTLMAQLKMPQETEVVVLTSSAQTSLHYLCQHLVGYCAQTTELKS